MGSFPGTSVWVAAACAKCRMRFSAQFRGSRWEQRGCPPFLARDAWGHMVRSGVAGTQTPSADSTSWAPPTPWRCPSASGYLVLLSPNNTEVIFIVSILNK